MARLASRRQRDFGLGQRRSEETGSEKKLGGRNWEQTEGTPLFSNDAPPHFFLFQLPNPLMQELPLWFLLGQRQRLLIRRPSLSCPAEPAVHICTGGMRQVIICQSLTILANRNTLKTELTELPWPSTSTSLHNSKNSFGRKSNPGATTPPAR
jgi:hypothetical protein